VPEGKKGNRQITVIEAESWAAALADLGGADGLVWSDRRANLLVSGVRLPREAGKVIAIGKALRIEVRCECDPCSRMDALHPGLRAALERLNPTLPAEAIAAAIDELTRDRSAMLLEQANREVYRLLKEGILVSVPDQERGGQKAERLRVLDWSRDGGTANNDFLLVSQFSVTGALYTCRPDLVGFVNGLPLVVIELKKPGVPAVPFSSDKSKTPPTGK
jgi:hypothetical protein